MFNMRISRLISLLISFALLVSPLPLTAMAENLITYENEINYLIQDSDNPYIYLGKELSNISDIIVEIGSLDDDIYSPLTQLKNHINNGLLLTRYNNIIDALQHAEVVLNSQYNALDPLKAQQLWFDLENNINQVINGLLSVDINSCFDENNKRSFSNIITVQGLLSVNDEIVQRLTAINLSATDAIIQNATITNLSVIEPVVQNLTATNLSVVEGTVTGTLSVNDEIIKDFLRFNDFVGGEYVGLRAPMTVPTSYTLSLPSTSPTAGQFLHANNATPTNLEWVTLGGSVSPALSKSIYVSKIGNDTTGNGSFSAPYATLSKAITTANGIASSVNPISIQITSGIYVEDNSAGPLAITADGISIAGISSSSVIMVPNTPTNNFLSVNNSIHISDMTFQSAAPLATGITLSAGNLTILNNVRIFNFLIGANCVGGPTNSYGFTTCFFVSNGTGINVNNAYVELDNSTIFGTSSLSGPSINNAIMVTGAGANLAMNGGVCGVCATGMTITGNSKASFSSVAFRLNEFDIVQNGASQLTLSGCTFELTTTTSDIDIGISGTGTTAEIISCEFSGSGLLGVPEGVAIMVTNDATVNISGGSMHNYTTGIIVGTTADTSSTSLSASALVIQNCTTDIIQQGSTSLNLNASTATGNKIIINNDTNVSLAFFDLDENNALTIGSTANVDTVLIQAAVTPSDQPIIGYKSSLYSSQGIGLENFLSTPSTWFALSDSNTNFFSITSDRTKIAGLRLVSDEGSPVGGISALRGWDVNKNGSSAELSFMYQNSDSSGQSLISPYTVMQLDGVNNQVQLPTAGTQIVFDADTNLYRSAANTLKTDDNFVVGTLTPNRAVLTDPVTNAFISGTATNTEVGYLSGVTSPIQTQLNNKVSRSGDSMTGALTMLTQNPIRLGDAVGNYVGLNGPLSVPSSYTLSLPSTTPTAHQILRANGTTPTNLEWITPSASLIPATSKVIYVAKYGNDITGDGSFSAPYASLSKAITFANTLATASNPLCISVLPGIYVENNSAGPLTITAMGISIVGYSTTGVIIMPSTPANDLLLINNTMRIADLTFQSSAPLATGVTMTLGNLTTYNSVRFVNFLTGALCSGGGAQLYGFSSCLFISNGTGLSVNDSRIEAIGCSFFGTPSVILPAVNTGINVTGAGANVIVDGGVCGKCNVGFNVVGNSTVTISSTAFKLNKFDILQSGASHMVLNGSSFELTNGTSDVDIQISGAGTLAEIVGCQFNGDNVAGVAEGQSILVIDNAYLDISSGSIKNYETAIQVGTSSDTASTVASLSGVTISNCINDIIQEGSSTLNVNATTASSNKIIINDPTNVKLAYFDLTNNNTLTIGSTGNVNTNLIATSIGSSSSPNISYKSSLYSTQGIGMSNPTSNPSSLYVTSNNNADLTAITKNRLNIAGVRLVSDTGSPLGGTSALRGWDINKNDSTAELSFTYQNSDIVGQSAVSPYIVMQLDGVNNQLQLPTAGTQIVFDTDTNLYRSAANTLKTDDNFIVGTLIPNRAVLTDPITNAFISGIATNTEIGYLSGVTSPIQTQLNNKVSRSGDSMTGALTMLTQNPIRLGDAVGNYVGLNGPLSVPSSYTLSLPTTAPVVSQTLRAGAVVPTNLEWVTEGGAIVPAVSETIYVTQYGNDITGNGSFDSPYASLAQAITVANSLASASYPVAILIAPGTYLEDNSAGPLTITTDGVAIVGDSANTTTIIPTTLSNDLLLINNSINIANVTFVAAGLSSATGISLAAGNFSNFNNLQIINFQVGVLCTGAASIYVFNNCLFNNNGSGLSVDNANLQCNNCILFGSSALPASNTGVNITGAGSFFVMSGGSFALCDSGISAHNNTSVTINAATFKFNNSDIVQSTASNTIVSGCTFDVTNNPTDISINISDAGTLGTFVGCEFNGNNSLGVPEGTAIFVHDNASTVVSSCRVKNYTTALQVGVSTDTNSTALTATGLTISSCTNDVIQEGSSSLDLNGSTLSSNKIIINDPANVKLAYFDLNDNNALTIGSTADTDTVLLQVASSDVTHSEINYLSSLYGTQAIGFSNENSSSSTSFVLSQDNANLTAITADRADIAGIRLVSDTGFPVGGTTALRGWDINKNGSAAALSFMYQNSDIVGQSAISPYVVMQLDGVNNQVQLPTAGTQIVFDTDTNLYRSAANTLKTDDNFIVGTLTPNRAVLTDPVTNAFISGTATNTEVGYLSGVTSPIQTQLNNKVSKTGDSMSGTLNMLTQNEVRFQDAAGGEYVGLNAPSTVSSSYTLSLPTTPPVVSQTLRAGAVVPTNLEWVTEGGAIVPAISETIYVTQYGNDITGNGSFDSPYASLAQAITTANSLASASYPVAILVAPGTYLEDNSAGPLTITTDGVAIVGDSANTTTIIPTTLSNDLLLINNSINIANVTFIAAGLSSATGISLAAGNFSNFNNLQIINFQIGVLCTGAASIYVFNNCLFNNNGSGLFVDNANLQCNNCILFGSSALPASNTGVNITGAGSFFVMSGGSFALCDIGISAHNNTSVTINAAAFKFNNSDIVQSTASNTIVSACTFDVTNNPTDISINISDVGTLGTFVGCEFNGNNSLGVPEGTAIFVHDNASTVISSCQVKNYTTALQVGISTDTSSTALTATGFIISSCTNDIIQEGLSSLDLNGSTLSSNKIIINDPANVKLAYFDLNDNNALTIGSTADTDTSLIQVNIDPINHPGLNYKSSLYSTQAIGFENIYGSSSSLYSLSANNADLSSITTDRTKFAGLRLVSDTGSPVGGTSALRGWDINKNDSTAELSFTYQNSDIVGQSAVSPYIVMQLDGVNNLLQLPTAGTQIVFDTDTNLYRSAANVLKTDDSFIVGTLTPDRVVITDAITNQLASSAVTSTELGYLSGVTSPIQTQLNGKVSKTGDIMTGALQLPAGTAAAPSLRFTGSTTTGLSAAITNTLSFDTNGIERLNIDGSGNITIDGFTTAGVVHNSAAGLLSSSLIVNADVDPAAAIVDTKLATISTAGKVANSATTATSTNTASAIVARDASSNFSAGTITANLIGNATTATTATNFSGSLSGDVTGTQSATVVSLVGGQTAANVAAATVLANAATSANTASTIVKRTATGGFSAGEISVTDEIISNSLTIMPFNIAGVLHNDANGLLSSSLIVNADVDPAAAIVDTKLATISTAGKVANSATTATSTNTASAIVARDASGNFSAGTITANLTGNATTATTATSFSGSLSGDVTGTQSATVVSLVGGQTAANVAAATVLANAATSANTASTIVKRTATGGFSAGVISVTDEVISNSATITPFNSAGIVHNDSSGLLSSSLIVNADVDPAAAIVDTKLATISTAGKVANSATTATSTNTASAIVVRDASGNFSAGTITANLTGNATTATTATNFSGSLSGDVTGTQSATVVSTVGGQTAANVAAATILANAATSANTASTIVKRSAAGGFSASAISVTDEVISSSLAITPFSIAGVLHNDSSGLISSSLIVNADITNTTISNAKLATASSSNTPGSIVVRDGSGNFATNMITLAGTTTNATDAATKAYVDSVAGTGLMVKNPAVVVSVANQTLSGLPTIDGVALTSGDRVLLTGQTNPVENGLWVADSGAWTRPTDFASGTEAGQAYVLILSGTSFGGSSWLCNTPNAIIDTGPISFALFSLPNATTGANVGVGTGLIYRDTIGNTLNFKSLIQGSHIVITNNSDDITLATDATNLNTANTTVARDASGNFSAGTITANLTGNATTATTATNFSGSLSGDVTGTQGATVVSTVGGQTAANVAAATVLANAATSANTASTIVRRDATGDFSASAISMTDAVISNSATITPFNSAGVVHNDANGLLSSSLIVNADVSASAGIVDTKLATISTAGKVANSATTATNLNTASAIVARDASGNFSAGTITANLTGNATTATTATNFSGSLAGDVTGTQSATVVSTVGGQSAANVAAATVLANAATSANTASTIVRRDATGNFSASAISMTDAIISNSLTITPFSTAGVLHNDSFGLTSSSLIVNADVSASAGIVDTKLATISTAGKVANSATTATSTNTASAIVARDASGNFSAGTITANLNGNATTATTATNFSGSLSGDVTGTQSATVVSTVGGQTAANVAAATVLANAATSANTASTIVKRTATGGFSAGAISITDEVISSSATITPFNSAGVVHNDSSGLLSSSLIVNADVDPAAAIVDTKLATISTAGKVANSATTATSANTASAIVARDASGNFSAGTITASLTGAASLNVLKTGDTMTGALQLPAGTAAAPSLRFTGSATTGISAAIANTLSFDISGIEQMNITSSGITIDGFTTAGVVHNSAAGLLSSSLIVNADVDPAAAIVDTKLATISTAGKVANSATTATSANTANAIVARDASGNFSAGTIAASLTGAASLNVLKAGDTMTGTLQLPAGTTALPSLVFTGSTTTGLSTSAGALSFSTNAIERMKIASGGTISVDAFTTAGVVHNDASGNLSTSLIVNADVDPAAAIVDTKLATISTAGKVANSATTATSVNTANAIVARDSSGNFSAGTITANLIGNVTGNVTGAASLNVLKTGDTMTGALQLPAGTAAAPSLRFTGSTTTGLSAATANTLSFDISGTEQMNITSSGVTVDGFTTAGVVHNSAAGLLSSSLIVNADVDPAAAIVDTKLATISTAGKVANSATTATSANTANAIVARDASGNFSAGTIAASLTGAASLNVLKAGDTMTGTLQLPAGTTALPSLVFTGSTTTGLSTNTGALSFSTNAIERMKIASGGTISVDAFTTAGVVHNDASGNLSTSLIVNADVSASAAIVDTKLATISTAGKVANSATTATNLNTANAIVARDSSGNFSAGTITANLIGNVTGNVTGAASLNVLKAGDTMTGALQLPAGTAAAPSLRFTGSTTTGISAATANTLSFDISGTEQMNITSSGVTIDGFTTAGVVHNSAAGLLSSSLIVNADVDPAAAIVDTKLATISTAGKVANSATTATSANTANAIVARDASGNFSAGTIAASLTGAASLNVLKVGDTMTGTLQLPAGTTALPSLVFTGSTTTGLSTSAGALSFSTNAIERMKIASGGTISVDAFTTAGVVHNDASGNLSTSLIVNADVDPAAAIVDTKLATISTAGKVANSATTATSVNTANAIVARDSSGNFSAGTITANLIGNVTGNVTGAASLNVLKAGDTMTGALQLPAGTAAAPSLKFTGSSNTGISAATANTLSFDINGTEQMNITSSGVTIDGFTTAGVVHNSAAGLLSSSLIVNADVDPAAAIVDTKLATISTAGKVANSATTATSANTANAIVARDSSGNFVAGTITASLAGAASLNVLKAGDTMTGTLQLPAGTTALPSLVFTGSTTTGLSTNTGALSFSTNAIERMKIASGGTISVDAFTAAGVVHNDASGNLSTSLIVNADVDPAAAIVDTKLATISTAGKVANSATTATSANTANAIVARDSSGNFSAGTITASLTGAASLNVLKAGDIMTGTLQLPAGTTTVPALTFTGAITSGLSAGANSLSLSTAAAERLKISSGGTISINAFTTAGTVHNDASGNLSSSLIVNADIDPAAAIVDTKLATISTAGKVANSATTATSANTASAIVARDASGNFSAGIITASLNGNATTATTATNAINFTGALSGDVTGTQSATVVSTVGGQTAANVAAATVLANAATNLNTANAIVKRDSTGSFAAQVISMTDGVHSGNLILSTEPSTSTTGNILKGSNRFIHDFGTNNTFVGITAGNFTTSGLGGNSGFGTNALTANSTGAFNTAIGFGTLATNTIGTHNTALGYNALAVSTTGSDNTAIGYNALATNTTGTSNNTAIGSNALTANTTGTNNSALGFNTLPTITTGSSNIAIGSGAGSTLTTGSGNIYINANAGAAAEGSTTRIGTSQTACFVQGIFGATTPTGTPALVAVDSTGKLGTATLTSTSSNTPNTIVQRDGSGNFSAGTITANLNGNATTATTATSFSGSLSGDVTGTQSATVVSLVGGQTAANVAAATVLANAATSANTANAIVARDASGNFSAGTITASLTGAASLNVLKAGDTMTGALQLPAGTAAAPSLRFTGSTTTGLSAATANTLSFDISGTEQMNITSSGVTIDGFTTAGVVHNSVAGLLSSSLIVNADVAAGAAIVDTKLATISTAGKVANSATTATNANTASAIVARDASGNFSAGTITASLSGNATTATTATNFSGSLAGEVTGTQSATVVTNAVSANTASAIVRRTATGGFSAGAVSVTDEVISNSATITPFNAAGVVHNNASGLLSSSLIVNADVDPAAAIVDTKLATISTAGKVANSATTATSANTANAIVARDASGNFSAGTITASLSGNATTATTATNFSGSLAGEVTGTQGATVVTNAVSANTASAIVRRTATGGFSAGAISVTDEVISNSATITPFNAAGVVHNNASGLLSSSLIVNADVDPAAAIVDTKLATISTAGKVANSATTATSANTANAIVARDASGNFITNMITLAGTTTNATDAATKAYVDAQVTSTGTNLNTPNTLVKRDSTGSFAAQVISMTDGVLSGNLSLSNSSSSTVGNIFKGGSRFIHNYPVGSLNTFVGSNSGSFSMTGTSNTGIGASVMSGTTTGANNTAIGATSLSANTTGSNNTAIGVLSLVFNTIGSSNTAVGSSSLQNNTTGIQNTGIGYTTLQSNVTGTDNTAIGFGALTANKVSGNTAIGSNALATNTTGNNNSAIGFNALTANSTGTDNSAIGSNSLSAVTTGSTNIAIGSGAGGTLTTGNGNIYINANAGTAAEGSTTRIGTSQTACFVQGIFGATTPTGTPALVAVDSTGKLGTATLTSTNLNIPNSLVQRDSTGSFATGVISVTDTVISNSATITPFNTAGIVHNSAAGLLSSSLIVNADVDPAAAIVDTKLATISTAGKVANSATTATSANTANAIVARDASGNFSAGTITASLSGNATTATTATNFSGSLAGEVTGTQGATVVTNAVSANTASAIVRRTATGGFSAGAVSVTDEVISNSLTITPFSTAGVVHNNASGLASSSLIVNADVDPAAAIVDTKLATISTAGKVANSATTATNTNTASAIVARDASGNFSAGTITASLSGNATTATTATNFSGSLAGEVTGTQGATVVTNAVSANTASAIVRRTATGGFSAGAVSVTDEVISNSLTITPFSTAGVVHNNASGLVSSSLIVNADVDPAAAIVDTKLATISTAGKVANSATTATNANTASAIVARDASGNFSAGTITASLSGNATTATTATNFSGSLAGEVTGTQGATVVTNAVSANTASAIVRRTATGDFSAGNISMVDNIVSGDLFITTDPSTALAGVIYKAANRFIHNAGTNNTFVGVNSGNFTLTGTANTAIGVNSLTSTTTGGNNSAVGNSALTNNTTGINNTAMGSGSLAVNTIGVNNTALGANALAVNSTGTDNTAIGFNALAANVTGTSFNTAVGSSALAANSTGTNNAAVGYQALAANTVGIHNTALGYNALAVNTTGTDNTAIGHNALVANATGTSFNTAVGSSALAANSTGTNNAAIGYQALAANTVGIHNTALGYNALAVSTTGTDNTAIGYNALAANATGTSSSTAVGSSALAANTTGINNTAVGASALAASTIGTSLTAVGKSALAGNTTGINNTAVGTSALAVATIGTGNTAIGQSALVANTTGINNTALGNATFPAVTTGSNNIAIGNSAGSTITTGSGNIYINANANTAAETNTIRIGTSQTACFIQGIFNGTPVATANVHVSTGGLLAITSSSKRFKHSIEDMNESSDDVFKLRPVTFVYNNDETESMKYGLIAEEVNEIFPELIVNDMEGLPYTVQYDVLPVLLLNEIKKQHITIEQLKEDNIQRDAIIKNLIDRIKSLEAKA